jgi:hypothetical protein
VSDREEMEENSNLAYIEAHELVNVEPKLRAQLYRVAQSGRTSVTGDNIDPFLFVP